MTIGAEVGGSIQEVRPGRFLHVATREGRGDTTLFFLHGAGGNKEQWRFQWRHFADDGGHPLVAWDAIGHGRSPQPRDPGAYAGAALLDDALALFNRHRTRRNIIVAHSYGARLALAWQVLTAARVDGLVLLGPAPVGAAGGRRLIGGWVGHVPLPLLELARPLLSRSFRRRAWHADADPHLVRAEQRATRGNSLFMMQALLAGAPVLDPDALDQVTAPVSILAGADDGLVPPGAVASLAERLPRASLRVLPRCGHQIMLEKPDETHQAIATLLTSLGA